VCLRGLRLIGYSVVMLWWAVVTRVVVENNVASFFRTRCTCYEI